jgi:hypothetical protein
MSGFTVTPDDLSTISLEALLRRIIEEGQPLTIRLSDTEAVILQPHTVSADAYWQRLLDLGLIKSVQTLPAKVPQFTPIPVIGRPVSQTIIEERR